MAFEKTFVVVDFYILYFNVYTVVVVVIVIVIVIAIVIAISQYLYDFFVFNCNSIANQIKFRNVLMDDTFEEESEIVSA